MISQDNEYLFASHGRFVEGIKVITEFVKERGMENWKLLTETSLKKQLAACLTLLNMSEKDLSLIAEAMNSKEKTELGSP